MEQIEMVYERELLSDREFEIAQELVFKGTKKEASQPLGITVRTVETQTKRIYEKLGITKLNELVLWYCAVAFDIAKQIEDKKKEVAAATGFTILMVFSITFDHHELLRLRRYRREVETEQVILSAPISGV